MKKLFKDFYFYSGCLYFLIGVLLFVAREKFFAGICFGASWIEFVHVFKRILTADDKEKPELLKS